MGVEMKLVCEYPVGTLRTAAAVNNVSAVAMAIRQMPGVGKPFLIFSDLPGQATMAFFDMYPDYVVSSDVSANIAMINAQLASPPLDAVIV